MVLSGELRLEIWPRFILRRTSATAAVAAAVAVWGVEEDGDDVAEDAAELPAPIRSDASWPSQELHLTGRPSVTISGVGPWTSQKCARHSCRVGVSNMVTEVLSVRELSVQDRR